MPAMKRMVKNLPLALRAARQLGWKNIWQYVWYQVQLRSGVIHWRTPEK
ncbi:MAG: hypothetical protein ACK2T7_11865 [Anaerolineales bacterium]